MRNTIKTINIPERYLLLCEYIEDGDDVIYFRYQDQDLFEIFINFLLDYDIIKKAPKKEKVKSYFKCYYHICCRISNNHIYIGKRDSYPTVILRDISYFNFYYNQNDTMLGL